MGTLTLDGELVFDNSHGGCSNKAKTKVNSTLEWQANAPADDNTHMPFIDRLSVVVNVQDGELQKDLYEAHFLAVEDQSAFKVTKHTKGFKKGFRLALESVPNSVHWPHYQYATNEFGVSKIRIDFVPKDIGLEGMYDLHACLTPLVPNGWQYFISNGTITRLDVATDVGGLAMDDFMIVPPQILTVTRRSNTGILQTVELGKPKGNQTCIYDRYQKRIAKGQGNKFGPGVRIERRLRTPNILLSELASLKNPFAKLEMVSPNITRPPLEKSEGKWLMFRYTVTAIGLESAIAFISPKRRTMYRKHFKSLNADWWDPSKIWSKWPEALEQCLVADKSAFK